MSRSASACLLAVRHQSAALAILKQVLPSAMHGTAAGRHALAQLIKFRESGASGKRQLSVAWSAYSWYSSCQWSNQGGPTSESSALAAANAVGLTCELRLDLTLIRNPECGYLIAGLILTTAW